MSIEEHHRHRRLRLHRREVVKLLAARGLSVRVLDDLSKPASSVKGSYEFVRLDLTDPAATREAFRGFDTRIHLAAKIGGIGYFHKYPATILSENNRIYSSVFEAAAAEKSRKRGQVHFPCGQLTSLSGCS